MAGRMYGNDQSPRGKSEHRTRLEGSWNGSKYSGLEEQFKNPVIKVSLENGVVINRHQELWDAEGVICQSE